jgi:nitrous oxidase accessory protein
MSGTTFNNNYWSEYAGYDLNKDGIGDIPYYPVNLFSYILDQSPETVVLMRSLFIDLLNYAEKISPVFTPIDVIDQYPLMTDAL